MLKLAFRDLRFQRLGAMRGDSAALTLDFLAGVLDPRITFTRAGTATYFGSDGLLKVAAVDVPRFDYDPVTLQPKGLLIEETRTNAALRSSEFASATWSKTNASVDEDAISTHLGAADNIVESAVTGTHGVNQGINVTAGTAYTFSFYAKANGRNLVRAGAANLVAYVVFDLAAGVVQHSDAGATGSIEPVGGGLFRCAVTQTATATGVENFIIRMQSSISEWPGSGVYAGDGVSGIAIIGAQLEVGTFPTSHIPTGATAVTRAAESAVMSGSNFSGWFNPSEGTFVVEASIAAFMQNRGFYGLSNGTSTNEMFAYCSPSRSLLTLTTSGGAFQGDSLMSGVVTGGVKLRYARAYAVNDLQAAADGVLSAPDNIATLPVGLDRMSIGHRIDSAGMGFKTNGHIRRLQYYRTRLPDSELQRLTS